VCARSGIRNPGCSDQPGFSVGGPVAEAATSLLAGCMLPSWNACCPMPGLRVDGSQRSNGFPSEILPSNRLPHLFFICTHCDRGQRYCSSICRRTCRLQQRRAARRRHQHSLEGRLDHRDRQRAYRLRRAAIARALITKSVTDHGSHRGTTSATIAPPCNQDPEPVRSQWLLCTDALLSPSVVAGVLLRSDPRELPARSRRRVT
jgi:hypothetical protein